VNPRDFKRTPEFAFHHFSQGGVVGLGSISRNLLEQFGFNILKKLFVKKKVLTWGVRRR